MEIIVLMIIATVVKSVIDSQQAKQKSKALGQVPNEGEPVLTPATPDKPKPNNSKSELEINLGEVMANFGDRVREVTGGAKKKGNATKQSEKARLQAAETAKKKKVAKDRAKEMERPAHEKLKPSVTPLKNAFENTEDCEHRMSLNPNMQYQRTAQEAKVRISINPSKDNVIQGVIWSEILGAPKSRRR